MLEHFPFMRKINRRQFDFFPADVIPYIQFGPVADRKYPYIFSFVNFTVVEVPQFRTLQLGVPLAKFIPYRKNPFLGPCLLLIPAGAANAGIKCKLFNGIEQRVGLQGVAAGKFSFWLGKLAFFDGVFYFSYY